MSPTATLVLLLEDEPLIAMDLEGTLRDAGFSVTTFGTCNEAQTWLGNHNPDLAVLDVHLTDGPCSPIAEALVARGVPFIVHSGEAEADHRATIFGTGKWLAKPARDHDLRAAATALTSV